MQIAYDPSREALYSPENRETVFERNKDYSDVQIAVEAARLSYIRAESSPTQFERLQSALSIVGFEKPILFHGEATDTRAFACTRSSDALTLIAFRGTRPDAIDDLLVDADLLLTEWSESAGEVHRGFASGFRAIRSGIEQWLSERAPPTNRLLLTGHSLGAALATLAASVWKPSRLVTLGSPRVGDETFISSVEPGDYLRLVNGCDLVTDVPIELGGYRHGGNSLYIYADGRVSAGVSDDLIARDRIAADLDYARRYGTNPVTNVLLRRLADHAPINYARVFF